MYLASDWKDYEIIDAGGGNKHERWADVTLLRPDPQAVWPMKEPRSVHARYIRSSAGGGHWEYGRALPESWKIRYRVEARHPLLFIRIKRSRLLPLKPLCLRPVNQYKPRRLKPSFMRTVPG